jgi:hypothetical protein
MVAVCSFVTLVPAYESTRRCNPKNIDIVPAEWASLTVETEVLAVHVCTEATHRWHRIFLFLQGEVSACLVSGLCDGRLAGAGSLVPCPRWRMWRRQASPCPSECLVCLAVCPLCHHSAPLLQDTVLSGSQPPGWLLVLLTSLQRWTNLCYLLRFSQLQLRLHLFASINWSHNFLPDIYGVLLWLSESVAGIANRMSASTCDLRRGLGFQRKF